MSQVDSRPEADSDLGRHRTLNKWWYYVFVSLISIGLAVAVSQIFLLRPFDWLVLMYNAYAYALLAFFFSPVYILFPPTKRSSRTKVPWYDILLLCLSLSIFFYLSIRGADIQLHGLLFITPTHITVMSVIACFLILEAVRRVAGWVLFSISTAFAALPLYTSYLPGFLEGQPLSFLLTAKFHILGLSSVLGIPMSVLGNLLVGFMVFGVAMASLGGGKFFLGLALALLGTRRGGPAKVAIVGSSFMGMLSGSAISNTITTGTITIPAMKKIGYPSHYAAAIEACASTGGMLMPPVMGVAAFLMAEFLEIPYLSVALAAAVPSILYYLCLFVQVDSYAAKVGMTGLPRSEIPSLKETLKEGWPYIFAIAVLMYFLFLRLESQAPFYASGVLILVAMTRKETRLNLKRFLDFIASSGKVLVELAVLLAGVGFTIGSFALTGIGSGFTRELLLLAGGMSFLILLFGAIASYILGMGLSASTCYILLAILMAPALVNMGFNAIAVHLFVLYWGLMSCITPPVAVVAFTAASIARSSFFKTGFQAMRLATAIYFISFFFVFQPALVLQGSATEIVHAIITAVIGVILLGGGIEGYFMGLGTLILPIRISTILSGLLLMAPGWTTDILGAIIFIVTVVVCRLFVRMRPTVQTG